MTDASNPVLVRAEGAVGHIVLNRPASLNAITVELGSCLERALIELAETSRVVVIRGAGGNFSVGGDFHEMSRLRRAGRAALAPLFENFGRACAVIPTLPVPVVAAVEGFAMAGGFELVQSCDITLVRSDATLADAHVNHGQIPGGGGSQRLARAVGRQRALAHLLGGERLTGVEAQRWGLAYRCWEPGDFEDGVAAFVARLASRDPIAVTKIKRLVHDGAPLPLSEALALEARAVLEHVTSAAAEAGMDRFTGAR